MSATSASGAQQGGGGRRRRRFNKKDGVTFHVVARSQQDPLSMDPSASKNVLQPHAGLNQIEHHFTDRQASILSSVPAASLQVREDLANGGGGMSEADAMLAAFRGDNAGPEHLEEDEYDRNPYVVASSGHIYTVASADQRLQKLNEALQRRAEAREVKSEAQVFKELGIDLPPDAEGKRSLKGVEEWGEEAEPYLPEDYLRALDGAAEEEGDELEDDFFALAMQGGVDDDDDDEKVGYQDDQEERGQFDALELSDGDDDDGDEFGDDGREEDEVDARQQRLLDEDFEQLLEEYDDDEIGELDEEDPGVAGDVEDIHMYDAEIDEFATRLDHTYRPNKALGGGRRMVDTETAHKLTAQQIDALERKPEQSMKEVNAEIDAMFPERKREKWDCETIVSTYTNTENHPAVIRDPTLGRKKQIRISRKTGIPIREEDEEEDDDDEEEEDEEEEEEAPKVRPRGETKEERKARKKAVKEARRRQRKAKKALKLVYKEQGKVLTTAAVTQQTKNPAVVKL